jgi:O-acetyl-ADP-ribose deacetylase
LAEVQIFVGDITKLKVSAVVNAANSRLAGGGGVDGAIHRAAGYEELQIACRRLGGCVTGEVCLTKGFKLPSKAIIHAVGPIWRGGGYGEAEALSSCYRNSMSLAEKEAFESIAFPAISCGVYGFPHEQAVTIAVREVMTGLERATSLQTVIFCCLHSALGDMYKLELEIWRRKKAKRA